jgi:TatD DNase family protein
MLLTDTHVHFFSSSDATAAIIERACAAGVTRLLAVGGSDELNAAACAAAAAFPATVRLAIGLDRSQALGADVRLEAFTTHAAALHLAAIGEAGLDYHYHPDTRPEQRALFAAMLRLAGNRELPIIVHARDADDDTLAVLDDAGSRALAAAGRLGVVHCFTGDRAFAGHLLDRGLYISFSGIVTFANADALRQVAAYVPADRLLIETDSPFLAPVPRRGQRNEPAFVTHVAATVARVRGVTAAELALQTSANAGRLFGPWPV